MVKSMKSSASFKDFGLAFFPAFFRPWPVFRHFAPAFSPYAHNYLAFFSGQRQALFLSSANAPCWNMAGISYIF
jgi:hypothetical protein